MRVAACVLAACVLASAPASAQGSAVKPWHPSQADTVAIWAQQALDVLARSKGGTLGSDEVGAFAQLNRVARTYFTRLGRERMGGAGGLVQVLDTLGHRAVVRSDPHLPAFTLVQFLHPVADGGVSLCYLYWFRGAELLSQAVNLHGGMDPELRVYWLEDDPRPYEAAILYRGGPGLDTPRRLYALRIAPDASGWLPISGRLEPQTLGDGGDAKWVDWNGDRVPEIAVWSEIELDPVFATCPEPTCPRVLVERVFWRHEAQGFRQVSERPAPSAMNAFVALVQALRDGRTADAERLVTGPALLEKARQLGLDSVRSKGGIRMGPNRCRICWPERLGFSITRADGQAVAAQAIFETSGSGWLLRSLETSNEGEGGEPSPGTAGSGGSPE